MSENDELNRDNSNRHSNFHVPKQRGTSLNHGWDSDSEKFEKGLFHNS
jgi:hypothetical protein